MGGGNLASNNKKGFTLLEVLAVIIVLAVIAIITIPIVTGVMNNARKNSFKASMTNLVKSANNYYADNQLEIDKVMTFCFGLTGSNCTTEKLKFRGKKPAKGKVIINPNGDVVLLDVSDGTYYANYDSGVDDDIVITDDNEVLGRDELTQAIKDLQEENKRMKDELNKKANQSDLDKVETQLDSTTTIANTANNTANSLNNDILNKTYPIGSIYISYNSTNPASLFGGTWVNYGSGKMLKGISSGTAGTTGGKDTVTLSTSNLPSHSHTVTAKGSVSSTFKGTTGTTSSNGNHTHTTLIKSTAGLLNSNGSNSRFVDGNGNVPTSSAGDHTHTFTPSGTVTSTFTGSSTTTSSIGSGSAINIQNPYITVYMWRRTS